MTRTRWAVLATILYLAAPLAANDAVESFLEAADMTFTLEEADERRVYDVAAPGGGGFELSEAEDGFTFTLDETEDPITPKSGDWSRTVEPTRVDCGPDTGFMANAVIAQLGRFEQILNNMIGSNDGGATARYTFTAPFTADQILDPNLEVLQMAQVFSEVTYDVGGTNLFTARGKLSQPSDFDIDFKLQLGVISENLVLGYWHGASGTRRAPCRAEGFISWWRR